MDDPELIGVDIFFAASKSREYRAQVRELFSTLAEFLQRQRLVTRTILREGSSIDESFVIRRSDLTHEGYEFYLEVERTWFDAIDRGTSADKTRMLERILADIRERPKE